MRKQFLDMNQGVSAMKFNLAMIKLFSDGSKFKFIISNYNQKIQI